MSSRAILKTLWCCFLCIIIKSVDCGQKHKLNANDELLRSIWSYRDYTVDPCENFYNYACGNWKNLHSKQHKQFGETLGMIDYKVNKKLERSLNNPKHFIRIQKYEFMQQLIKYYISCRSLSLSSVNYADYLSYLQSYEHIPKVNSLYRKYDWVNLLAVLAKYGLNGVFWEVTVISNPFDTSHWILDLDKPLINEGFKPFTRNEIKTLHSIMEGITVTFTSKKVEIFEKKLQTIYELTEDTSYTQVTLSELKMPWIHKFLKILFESKNLDTNTRITVQNLNYLRNVWDLVNSQNSHFIAYYIKLRFYYYIINKGPRDFSKLYCLENTRNYFPLAMNFLYELQMNEKDLSKKTADVRDIFENLRNKFRQTIQQNKNNFKPKVQKLLLEKIQDMILNIGNIPRGNTTQIIEQYYMDLKLNTFNFCVNHLKLLKHNTQKRLELLKTSVDRQRENYFYMDFCDTGCTSSPYYVPTTNMIIVPLSLLEMPLYHTDFEDILKYSSLGFLLSHELTHAFDENGLTYNKSGKMIGRVELIENNERFRKNMECLRADEPEILDEKIADVTGLRLAFETYFNNKSDVEGKKLFFSNFAIFFCGNSQEAIPDDIHGTDEERVMFTLSNFPEFSSAYNCSIDSPMILKQNCYLWR